MDPFQTHPTVHPRYLDDWHLRVRGQGYAYLFQHEAWSRGDSRDQAFTGSAGDSLQTPEVQLRAALLFEGGYLVHNFVTGSSSLTILRFEPPALYIDIGNFVVLLTGF